MSLVHIGRTAEVDGYIGYMEPYATSHQALDKDDDFQQQTRNAARALGNAINLHRAGKYERPDEDIEDPNPK
ncbi:MAG TPA: NADPH-dependent FMN reductase, partial [Bradyrhizobium sp.]|nr:NADPH-dependent FMN reductase [Bradyrhizobium sp.]